MGKALRAWKVTCPRSTFEALRADPTFQQITTLARVLNVIRFFQAAVPSQPRRTPGSARQQVNAFYFMAATLFEGWNLAVRLGQRFRSYASWSAGFGAILKDQRFRTLFSASLKPLRHQTTFHFFEREIALRLKEHDSKEVVFVTGRGPRSKRTYYDLPDLLALRTFVNVTSSDEELLERAEPFLTDVARLAMAFLRAGDSLVVEALDRMGFKEEPGA